MSRNRLVVAAGLAAGLSLPLPLHALVPAFARQTGLACTKCHTQHFPSLNAFGRDFKMNGFTLASVLKIEGTRLSIPAGLNASIYTKLRYQKTNGDDAPGVRTTNSGEWQFPDEFALLVAGRVSEYIGFILEGQFAEGGAPVFASFKIPFAYKAGNLTLSVIPFSTDALGVAYGFEQLSTGAVRNLRPMEHRRDYSAQQYVGSSTPATGAAFVVGNKNAYANFTRWAPAHAFAAEGLAGGFPTADYLRVAVTPTVGEYDVGVGFQAWFGSANVDDGSGTGAVVKETPRGWAIDGQVQGSVGRMTALLTASYANADGSAGSINNTLNGAPNDRKAWTVAGELGVVPDRLFLLLAYRNGNNGAATLSDDNAVTVGAIYHLYQNVQFQGNFSTYSGSANSSSAPSGNSLLTLMLAAAF
ncbi:MAG TPA: hypothetical protein VLB49_10160 [Gemmatimonadales bacterium]|nr:hypothetical protein [Gemmatimonadales bacterium]